MTDFTPGLKTFSSAVGSPFHIGREDPSADLILQRIEEGAGQADMEQYALYFHGPADPMLMQGSYRLNHAQLGTMEIFIVPVGRVGDRIEYEACFNHPATDT